MNFGELIEDVLTQLDTSIIAPKFWSIDDVKDALNEGYEEISDACEWLEVVFPLALQGRRTYYDINTFGDRVLTILHVFNFQTTRHLSAIHHRDLDQHLREWMRVEGQPDWMFRRGINWLGFFPFSGTSSGQLQLAGTAIPRRMVQLTDEPGFPSDFHRGLTEYALCELKGQDHEPAQALEHFKSYLDYEAALLNHMMTRTSLDANHQIGST